MAIAATLSGWMPETSTPNDPTWNCALLATGIGAMLLTSVILSFALYTIP